MEKRPRNDSEGADNYTTLPQICQVKIFKKTSCIFVQLAENLL